MPAGPVTVTFDADAPPGARSVLICGGRPVAEGHGGQVRWTTARQPRRLPGGSAPSAGGTGAMARDQSDLRAGRAGRGRSAPTRRAARSWSRSTAAATRRDGRPKRLPAPTAARSRCPAVRATVSFTWRLGEGADQYSAIRFDAPPVAGHLRSADPARAVRPADAGLGAGCGRPQDGGRRWGRSVYLEPTAREVVIPLAGPGAARSGWAARGPARRGHGPAARRRHRARARSARPAR